MNYEELYTLVTEVEMLINFRPLTYIYEADTVETITPSHLVIGRRLQTRVSNVMDDFDDDYELEQTHEECTRRVKYLQTLLTQYWNKFHNDYLNELRETQLYNKKKNIAHINYL